jgi:hypothetical protein
VVTYLYSRKRIPRTVNLCEEAVHSGSVDMVRLVRQRDAHWHASRGWGDTNAIKMALVKGHVDIARHLIEQGESVDMCSVADMAASLPCVGVIDWLRKTRPDGWDAQRTLCVAAKCNNVDVVANLVRETGVRLEDALDMASSHDSARVVEFLLDHAPRLCPKRALGEAGQSPATIQWLMRRYPALDARYMLDTSRLSTYVARMLHKAYPQHSLQGLLDRAHTPDIVRFAYESGRDLDLQQALNVASIDKRFFAVQFLYSMDPTLDLTRAVVIASTMRQIYALQMLYGVCPEIDLQSALDATMYWDFAKDLLDAYPHLGVGVLVERFGIGGEWAFLRDRM